MRIKTATSQENLGSLLIKQEWIDTITEKSGSIAQNNEFQVHYWALVARNTFDDGSISDLVIPLVFFNYPQQVTTVAVDYNNEDVEEMSTKTEPIAVLKAKELVEQLRDTLPAAEFMIVPKMTLHRHP